MNLNMRMADLPSRIIRFGQDSVEDLSERRNPNPVRKQAVLDAIPRLPALVTVLEVALKLGEDVRYVDITIARLCEDGDARRVDRKGVGRHGGPVHRYART